ncbi:MAG: hypothetical protein A2W76_02665 [Gammaproteobacteria bacterium RIFCSPLOWO2_12_47_11]|nr:MAG: hypothetical protein A2W76_02665 [Gammaproteobacteria bacterium RIFCSPLOWO2_12_47_11]
MIELIIFICLLLAGYIFGQMLEQSHYRSIRKRESLLRNIPLIASKKLPDEFTPCTTSLVAGNVVISVDFFKKFVAGLRNLVGGRVTTYESLIDRARREALLRMREEARQLGANYVFNVKMETSSISKGQRDTIGSVEVLAYGTAIKLAKTRPEMPVDAVADV